MYTEFHIVNVADAINDLNTEYERKFGCRIRLNDITVKIRTVTDEELCNIKCKIRNTDNTLIASISDRNYVSVYEGYGLVVIICHEFVSELPGVDNVKSLVKSIDTSCFRPARY